MSDYHVLSGRDDGNALVVVCHVPVPNVTNQVGVNYRAALVQSRGWDMTITSAVPFIQEAEFTLLQAGELSEELVELSTCPAETLAQKRDRMDALYLATVTRVQQRLSQQLAYWGYSRDTP